MGRTLLSAAVEFDLLLVERILLPTFKEEPLSQKNSVENPEIEFRCGSQPCARSPRTSEQARLYLARSRLQPLIAPAQLQPLFAPSLT